MKEKRKTQKKHKSIYPNISVSFVKMNNNPLLVAKSPIKTNVSDLDIKDYLFFQSLIVECGKCHGIYRVLECFNYNEEEYICIYCAIKLINNISELKDWEACYTDINNSQFQIRKCDRLTHYKKSVSFVKCSKRSGYKYVNICNYCRLIKQWEYGRKKK